MKRVIGIGNALTDMLVNLKTDSVLGRFKLAKGSMSLVDTKLQTEISKSVAGLPYSLSLGGSAGNTIRAMAQLGCSVGFIGKVGRDSLSRMVMRTLEGQGVDLSCVTVSDQGQIGLAFLEYLPGGGRNYQ